MILRNVFGIDPDFDKAVELCGEDFYKCMAFMLVIPVSGVKPEHIEALCDGNEFVQSYYSAAVFEHVLDKSEWDGKSFDKVEVNMDEINETVTRRLGMLMEKSPVFRFSLFRSFALKKYKKAKDVDDFVNEIKQICKNCCETYKDLFDFSNFNIIELRQIELERRKCLRLKGVDNKNSVIEFVPNNNEQDVYYYVSTMFPTGAPIFVKDVLNDRAWRIETSRCKKNDFVQRLFDDYMITTGSDFVLATKDEFENLPCFEKSRNGQLETRCVFRGWGL